MQKDKKSFIAIITARAGSKGIKNKNLRLLDKKPLINYTLNAAKKSKFIKDIFVSTDGKEIKSFCISKKIKVIDRPKYLSGDVIMPDASVLYTLKYLIKTGYDFDNVVFLQPTSAIRKKHDIDNAIKKFKRGGYDSLFSGVNLHPILWTSSKKKVLPLNFNFKRRPRRQSFKKDIIIENGSIYIARKKIWLKYKNRFGGKVGYYQMDLNSVHEVDEIHDIELISHILKKNYARKAQIIK